jgi:polyhydroxybutyrate depolymerase
LPVVLAFPGGGSQGDRGGRTIGRFTGLDAAADRHGFLAVYPNAHGGNWSDGRGIGASAAAGLSDVAYVDALVDDLAARHEIDRARLYVTGVSNGAFFSSRLACERADRFAGFVMVIGTLSLDLAPACAPARPVPILYVLGTEDPLVPYAGGVVAKDRGTALGADETLASWALHFACGAPVREDLPDLAADDGTTTVRERFPGCAGGVRLELLEVRGGGHTWPGGGQYLPQAVVGRAARDFSATAEVVAFFGLDVPP